MRTFEILLLLSVTLLPFVHKSMRAYIRPIYLLLALGALVLLHLLLEGYRWQMIPAYLLVIVLAWQINTAGRDSHKRWSFAGIIATIGWAVVLAIGWVLPMALPVFSLPEPQGPYIVGTQSIELKTGLDEIITDDPNDERVLSYKIWYPGAGEVSNTTGEPYVDQASRAGFATKYGLPPAALNYLDHVQTFA